MTVTSQPNDLSEPENQLKCQPALLIIFAAGEERVEGRAPVRGG